MSPQLSKFWFFQTTGYNKFSIPFLFDLLFKDRESLHLPLLKPTCQPHQKCFTWAVRESSLPAQNNRKLPTCDWELSPLKNSVCTILDHCYITGTSAEEADRKANIFLSSLVESQKVWFHFGLPECFCKRTLFWRRRKKGVRRRREWKRKRENERRKTHWVRHRENVEKSYGWFGWDVTARDVRSCWVLPS